MTPAAIVWGLTLGLGLVLVASWLGARRATLEQRVAPQLREHGPVARGGRVSKRSVVERLLAPALRDGVGVVAKWGAPTKELEVRLRRAGSNLSVDQFRAEQVVWAIAGLVAGLVLSGILASTRASSPLVLLVLTVVLGGVAFAARDYMLTRDVARRESAMAAELPTIAELLALSVGAGEGALGALERVVATTSGELARELSQTLAEVRGGSPLSEEIRGLAQRTGASGVRRFADATATAIDRGTPLAAVLRAQAQDARSAGRRDLMEQGGKKEIAMMVPVVFLILPITIVFAVFPGLIAIDLGG
ncbi:type II secretion system F family protein [Demequina oxidasica]|uniref:type II secretion system F family protein n=1 Tax=Demequina oxidasica TaxID=676199 RepID=UPI000783607E|nr:type II secretion system F family protein [Demequina oxidasica]